MLDIGWSEMLLIAVVAIIVIGPKDLPRALRTVGQWVGRARSLAREFQNSVDQMIAEAEIDEIKKTANSIADFSANDYLDRQIDPTGPAAGDTDDDKADAHEPALQEKPAAHGAGTAATGTATVSAAAPDVAAADYHPPDESADEEDTRREPDAVIGPAPRAGET